MERHRPLTWWPPWLLSHRLVLPAFQHCINATLQYTCVPGFFCSTLCLWDASLLVQIAAVHFYCCLVFYNLSIHHTLDGRWIASNWGCYEKCHNKYPSVNLLTDKCMSLSGICLGIELLGQQIGLGFCLVDTMKVLQSGCANSQFYQLCMRESSGCSKYLVSAAYNIAAIFLDVQCYFVVVFICIFLIPVEVKALFIYLLTIWIYEVCLGKV